jgi:hypothetical protein
LTARSGKSDGGLAGRTGGVIKQTGGTRRCVRILYKYCWVMLHSVVGIGLAFRGSAHSSTQSRNTSSHPRI